VARKYQCGSKISMKNSAFAMKRRKSVAAWQQHGSWRGGINGESDGSS